MPIAPIVVDGLFEAHLVVADLERAIGFYRDVLGLRVATIVPSRRAAFLWVGAEGTAMLGLWEGGAGPQRILLHVAFRTTVDAVLAAPAALASAGVESLDFDGKPTGEPVVLAWMPAVAAYFRDPDGHLLEYIAMLPQPPRPERGVVPWRIWEART